MILVVVVSLGKGNHSCEWWFCQTLMIVGDGGVWLVWVVIIEIIGVKLEENCNNDNGWNNGDRW